MFPQFSVFASAAAVVRLMSLTHCTLLLPSWMIHFFFCCRLVRRTLVSHLPHFSLSTTPWRQTAITGCFIPGWLDLLAAFCHLHRSGLEASRLSKCVEAVRSLTMSIFLLVRFVTSVTKEKKAFFRSVTDAWPFSPSSSAWSGALFCSWRESSTSICTFSCL